MFVNNKTNYRFDGFINRHENHDNDQIAFLLAILLFATALLLLILSIYLYFFEKYTRKFLDARDKYHLRAVNIHENYLSFPSYIADADYWRDHFEKAKIDYAYLLKLLLPFIPSTNIKEEDLPIRKLSGRAPNPYQTNKEPGSHSLYAKDAGWACDSAPLLMGLIQDPDPKTSLTNPLAVHYKHCERRRNRRILDEQNYKKMQREAKKNSLA